MQTLHQIQALFEQHLSKNQFREEPAELYEPARYILSLGGKRLRPALVLLGHWLYEDSVEKALPAAVAIELFHNFSLLHDDIMDAATLRRGHASAHTKFGVNTTILAGDVMLVYAYENLMKLQSPQLLQIIGIFNRTAIEVCEGQQMDLNFETSLRVSVSDYLKMIELKTSVLVAAALQIGALLGGSSGNDAECLYEFGKNLGIAFQLQDDWLDAFGDPKKFGKKQGGDIVQNKKTYLYLAAQEAGSETERNRLDSLFSQAHTNETAKIGEVMEVFNLLEVSVLTKNKIADYLMRSLHALEKTTLNAERKQLLEAFARSLMEREV